MTDKTPVTGQHSAAAARAAALDSVTQAIEENLAAWKTAADQAAHSAPTVSDNVEHVMKALQAVEKKMGVPLRSGLINKTAESVEVVTGINLVTHANGIQSAHEAPHLIVEAAGARLKTAGPATETVSELMTVEQALDAVVPAAYKEPKNTAAPTALETQTEAMIEGLTALQKALAAVGASFEFNVASKSASDVRIKTNVAAAADISVRSRLSFDYAAPGDNRTKPAAGSVSKILADVGRKAARQFKVGGGA